MSYEIINQDCIKAMQEMTDGCIDAIVTDPPYGLAFMGAKWDSFNGPNGKQTTKERQDEAKRYAAENKGAPRYGNSHGKKVTRNEMVTFQDAMTPIFEEALRVAKPGAHMLCFGGTRTFHRMACAIEDAGWEIRDTIMWVYGSGFPKSMDVAKAIEKQAGVRSNYGSAFSYAGPKRNVTDKNTLKSPLSTNGKYNPAPLTMEEAKKWDGWGTCLKPAWEPIIVARKPLDGTVAHNVMTYGTGAINIDGCRVGTDTITTQGGEKFPNLYGKFNAAQETTHTGRFPANLVHDGSQEVLELMGDAQRFFYCAKASKRDRGEGNDHPTVKPNALMRWLVRLVCPQGGMVLDPFMGSGSTGVACIQEGMRFVGIDMDEHYCEIAEKRIGAEPDTV